MNYTHVCYLRVVLYNLANGLCVDRFIITKADDNMWDIGILADGNLSLSIGAISGYEHKSLFLIVLLCWER